MKTTPSYYQLKVLEGKTNFNRDGKNLPAEPVDYSIFFSQRDEAQDGLCVGTNHRGCRETEWILEPDASSKEEQDLYIPIPEQWVEQLLVLDVLEALNQ